RRSAVGVNVPDTRARGKRRAVAPYVIARALIAVFPVVPHRDGVREEVAEWRLVAHNRELPGDRIRALKHTKHHCRLSSVRNFGWGGRWRGFETESGLHASLNSRALVLNDAKAVDERHLFVAGEGAQYRSIRAFSPELVVEQDRTGAAVPREPHHL